MLDRWEKEFIRTRTEIENELTIVRWDFNNPKQLFEKPVHMVAVLRDLKSTCKITKEFYNILSNELAAVTGSRSNIDNVREKVSDQVVKLAGFVNDIFLPDHHPEWEISFRNFLSAVESIEEETIQLINNTFSGQLNSAAGAFDLLDDFNDVDTRPKIRDQFETKYTDVLDQYRDELVSMESLF